MKIEVTGNRLYFKDSNEEIEVKYSLMGDPSLKYDNQFYLKRDYTPLIKQNQNQIFQLSERIKGCEFPSVPDLLKEAGLDNLNYIALQQATEIEIGIVKSIFLIYQWTEYVYTLDHEEEIISNLNLNDEFIIDYQNRLSSQMDLYFLPSIIDIKENKKELYLLKKLNLLCYLQITHSQICFENYFIPLLKPGTTKDEINKFDKSGETYKLWINLLSSRDKKLRKTFNNS